MRHGAYVRMCVTVCVCVCVCVYEYMHTVTVTVTGNLLNTKVLTLVSRQLSQPVQSPSDMQYRPPGRH